ncbi:uncharacterized protein LOC106667617 isoform X2 [Cimex lectularius]|uniref:EB domain-containing protein n=1 Tax=Cimex lectularius TaxID=79782 RepID=A0A8I6TI46_CIMLE|nr:uncharacterized protein LOC106667617 isoform X2 [Cimex lectularius]
MFQFHYFLLVFAFFEQALGIYLQACSDDLNCNFNTTALRCSKIDQKCTCIRYHYWDPKKNICVLNYYSLKKSLSHSESKDEELFIKGKESIETKRYHQNCTHDDHCQDFSLICSSEINKCVCAKFHDLIFNKCVLNYTELNLWLASLENEKDVKAELDRKAVGVFHQLAFSGILAIGLGILGAFFYVFIFCLMKHTLPYTEPVDEPESQKSKDDNVNDIETVSPVFLDF